MMHWVIRLWNSKRNHKALRKILPQKWRFHALGHFESFHGNIDLPLKAACIKQMLLVWETSTLEHIVLNCDSTTLSDTSLLIKVYKLLLIFPGSRLSRSCRQSPRSDPQGWSPREEKEEDRARQEEDPVQQEICQCCPNLRTPTWTQC